MRAMKMITLLGVGILVGAGGVASANNIRLTIVSAKLDGAKIAKGPARSGGYLSDLACLSTPGLREQPGLCGHATLPAGSVAVDSLARVEIGDAVVRTYPVPGTLTPHWEYGVILDGDFLAKQPDAVFSLVDFGGDGNDKEMAKASVKVKELIKPGEHTIKLGTHELVYKTEALTATAPRTYAFRVPADKQMADLAKTAKIAATSTSGEYVVIPVAEGELVAVTATGKVQPNAKKHPDRVAGPEGIPTITTKIQFNQPGFRGCAGCDHAALIGQIGSQGIVLGKQKSFKAETSGLLILAINDLKVEDNAGAFDVSVTVTLPAATPAVEAPAKKKGGKSDAVGRSLDPRVLEQVIDSHGNELDACVAKESNPYGALTLLFSISADGSLLGVVVENASPNLKNAGECMRKKALTWRFPPPRGVLTARYPLSFNQS